MSIYAIADLHISYSQNKPMDIFGVQWQDHEEQIRCNWGKIVQPDDLVLCPGDISWAMHLEDARYDLARFFDGLPGRVLLLKGNHDYWMDSLKKTLAILPENIHLLRNNSFSYDDCIVMGTRGWICPGTGKFDEESEKIYQRELERFELSLKDGAQKQGTKIAMLHYPPFNEQVERSGFVELMQSYGVQYCVYGHLHGPHTKEAFEGEKWGIEFKLVSSDHLDFKPLLIAK